MEQEGLNKRKIGQEKVKLLKRKGKMIRRNIEDERNWYKKDFQRKERIVEETWLILMKSRRKTNQDNANRRKIKEKVKLLNKKNKKIKRGD